MFGLFALLAAGAGLPPAAAQAPAAAVTLTPLGDRVRVEIGGQLFTEYIYGDGASRSYCYPILAADGTPLTRNFPMQKVAGEETDHPWHRSFYFAHSEVGGVDFWNEGTGDNGAAPANKGHTVVEGPVETSSGPVGVIHVHDRWLDHDGALICTDERTIRFHASASGRFIDFEIALQAPADRPLLIGDNKDGTMAVRLAEWLTMAHKNKAGPARRHRPYRHREGRPGPPGLGQARGLGRLPRRARRPDLRGGDLRPPGQPAPPDLVDGPRLRAVRRQSLRPARL